MALGYELQPDVGSTWSTFSPTVTLVGGAGNTVPVYTVNTGRYRQVGLAGAGGIVFVEVQLSGDGGAEGAGTGTINVALPVAAGANVTALEFNCGQSKNNITFGNLIGLLTGGGTTIALEIYSTGTTAIIFNGNGQNNTTRYVTLNFWYEV